MCLAFDSLFDFRNYCQNIRISSWESVVRMEKERNEQFFFFKDLFTYLSKRECVCMSTNGGRGRGKEGEC